MVAVGPDDYTTWEGYVEEDTGRAVIGLSYAQLCRDVKPGGRILLADGSITIKVWFVVGLCFTCCCCLAGLIVDVHGARQGKPPVRSFPAAPLVQCCFRLQAAKMACAT